MTEEKATLLKRERERFPIIKKYAYFETASTGLIPDYVYEGVKKYQDDRYLVGGDSDWNGKGTLAMMADSKALLAEMINCSPDDIAFGLNSSHLFTLFSEGIQWKPGDNVILSDNAWISTRFTWQTHEPDGLELRYAQTNKGAVTPEQIMVLADDRTRVIALSLVESSTGFRQDLDPIGAFCRERGIYLAVDGVQALGVLPVDVKKMKIDFLVGNDYKWMMHYCGIGFAYVSPALRGVLRQWGAGWMSDAERFNATKQHLTLRDDAGRYELGYPNAPGIYALGMVASHYLALGKETVEDYVLDLMDYLDTEIGKIPGAGIWARYERKNQSSIAVILLSNALKVTSEKLLANGVFAHTRDGTAYGADSAIRVSLHYYNNHSDIDRLVAVIKNCAVL
jgi:cysteine desulfurase / selenocysteine lyase